MTGRRRLFAILMAFSLLTLEACSDSAEQTSSSAEEQSPIQKQIETIEVKRGKITPTLSDKVEITTAEPFFVFAPEKGVFTPSVAEGKTVKAGEVLGQVNGNEISAPAAAKVIRILEKSEIPKNYPLVLLQYSGFALKLQAEAFLRSLPGDDNLSAKFQIENGSGPTNALAVLPTSMEGIDSESVGAGTVDFANMPIRKDALLCLIDKEVEVQPGALATTVITATPQEDQLLLPVSAIAGRFEKGQVTLIKDGVEQVVDVTLGPTDGAYMVILNGLREGDQILSVPPNLDPRQNR